MQALLPVSCMLLCPLTLNAAEMQNHSRDGICKAAAPLQLPKRTADRLQLAGVFNGDDFPAYVYLNRNAFVTAARLPACFHVMGNKVRGFHTIFINIPNKFEMCS